MTIQATTPGKVRVPVKGNPHPNYPFRQNSIVISIRPLMDIYLDGPPEHDEKCSIVWKGNKRYVKFISRACPYHRFTECLVEQAN